MSIVFFNTSLEIGGWLTAATSNITGSMFVTGVFVVLLLLCIAALFRIPIIFFLIVSLPLFIIFGLWDVTGGMMTFLMIVIIIIGWALAKTIFAYR
jgi:hypothetical protein